MRRRKRNVEIISLSAIDMFASTLGAFVIITAILLPYYPNMKDGGAITARLKSEIEASEQETAEARDKRLALLAEEERRKDRNTLAARAAAARKALEQKAASLKSANDDLDAQIAGLRAELATLKTKAKKKKKKVQGAQGLTDFSILGITTKAKRILIVVDLSGSMNRWSDTLVQTLVEIIEPFHKDIQFGLIGFQGFGISQYWPKPGRLAIADSAGKSSARSFIARIPGLVNGGTPTKTAMIRALKYRPEAIILVSDGAPDDAEPDDIINTITRLNGGRAEINTVAVGDYLIHSTLIQFLNQLAIRNKGQFVGVMND